MKLLAAFIFLSILTACQMSCSKGNDCPYTFYIGTYTGGDSKGIYQCMLKRDGVLQDIVLASELDNPSFLALSKDRNYLLAISEVSSEDNEGSIVSYAVRKDTLEFVSRTTSGGAHPCFIAVNDDGYVLAANYTGGNIGLVRMNENGRLSDLLDLKQHTGQGPTDRQKGPHAHSAWFLPGEQEVIAVDLGTDELWFYHLDTMSQILIPEEQEKLGMAPGAGPRHVAFHPDGKWIYVINELSCTVTQVLKGNKGKYEIRSSISTLPDGYKEPNTCADIHLSPDGKFLYASNRGHNSLAIYSVNKHDGTLTAVGYQPVHGSWPRNFALSPDGKYLLVANQRSDNIVSFRRDEQTGMLEYLDETETPSPVCIVFHN
ncbi:MAG: lactonase family protein [Bacteroidales bacterium]|nr:lactonase family protein [Bacteroidales bacterium]MBN2699429.1 lactonase family protein [Bacteroidales bacterium]